MRTWWRPGCSGSRRRRGGTTIRALESTGGEAPSEQTIADALGVSVEAYRADLAHLVHVDVQSLDCEGATQIAANQVPVDELAGRRQALSQVRAALDLMEPRDVTLLGLHYLEELAFQEIATMLKITPSRACQLLWRAVERLRAQLGAPLSEAA